MTDGLAVLSVVLLLGTVSGVAALRHRAAWQKAVRLAHGPFDLATAAPRIDANITTLSEACGADTFAAPPVELPAPSPRDRLQFLRDAVALAAERFQVTLPPVDLQFAPPGFFSDQSGLIDAGGENWQARQAPEGLSLQRGDESGHAWRIRIAVELRRNDAAILIIAAHEVAHLVLYREQLDWDNEELVDTAAVLAGYGPLMRRFRSEPQGVRIGGRLRTIVCGPGYLHPNAIDYIWRRREELAQQRS